MSRQIFFSFLFFVIAFQGYSQRPQSEERSKTPRLNGHFFPSSNVLKTSFITTHFQADIGAGATSKLKVPGIVIEDIEIFEFEGRLGFAEVNVEYQQRFTPWLALFISGRFSGRMGVNMSTIVADGVNSVYGGDIGWLMRVYESSKLNLSVVTQVNSTTGNFINLERYIEELINNEPFPSVSRTIPSLTVGTGIRGAYAFNEKYGLQFDANLGFGEALSREKTQAYFSAGFLADVDFYPQNDLPIGLAIGYSLSSAPHIVMDNPHLSGIFTGRLGYTGSKEFELALVFNYYDIKIASIDSNPFVGKALLQLKLYF